jgi:hypothetical protein
MVKYILLSILALTLFAIADGYIDYAATRRAWDRFYSHEITEDELFSTLIRIERAR